MIDILKNEILSFVVIAAVVILLAFMSRKREQDFKKFDENEENSEDK